eukprot:scaffold56129_cov69-Phaeocystis_antarctica.AAC.3
MLRCLVRVQPRPETADRFARQPECVQRWRCRRLVSETERPLREEEEVVGRRRLRDVVEGLGHPGHGMGKG